MEVLKQRISYIVTGYSGCTLDRIFWCLRNGHEALREYPYNDVVKALNEMVKSGFLQMIRYTYQGQDLAFYLPKEARLLYEVQPVQVV